MLSSESAAPSARVFALVTGTMGLLAVGVLLLTVTPSRQDSPIALSASTTLARPSTALASAGPTGALVNPDRPAEDALATPIGDGQFALVTSAALGDNSGTTISVRFTSGRVGLVEVVDRSDGALVLVALGSGETGHPIADERPAADEIVTVLASPPITVPFADVAKLEVREGTPVFDQAGALVGLCSRGKGVVQLLEPTDELARRGADGPATTPPAATTTTVIVSTTVTTIATTTSTSIATSTTVSTTVPASQPGVSP